MEVTADRVRSAAELTGLIGAGVVPEYLLFWGHRAPPGDGVGSGCLSQWWPAGFAVGGIAYTSAEQYMMWEKALLFGDAGTAEQIRRARHPGDAKRLGRQVRGFDERAWARRRYGIVVEGNLAKFGQNPALAAFLLGTSGKVLVEAAPGDRIWGIGLTAADEDATHPERWRGLNLLGFALMEVRHRLAAELASRPARGACSP